MNTKDLEIKYTPTFSNKPHVPEYDLIDTLFDRVDYTEREIGIYEFDFYDKEGGLHQSSIDLKNVYTDYRKWSERFFIYFVMMDKIVLKDTWILRRVIANSGLRLSGESIEQYVVELKKKAFPFILDLALKEIELINENNGQFFIEQIENNLKSTKKKNLAESLGLRDTGNFFINFLSSVTWNILDQITQSRILTGSTPTGYITKIVTRMNVGFEHCDDKLQIAIKSLGDNTSVLVLQDLEVLKEKGKFIPIFTDNSIYKEPEITKLGGYNILKNGNETIYLTGSFIVGPVDDFSLFEKSKLTIAGVERILNIKHNDLQAKIAYALISE